MYPVNLINQISKSSYHLKQRMIHKINPKRCKFILLNRISSGEISEFKNLSTNIPENADSFTIVSIGKRDDEKYRKVITTFYTNKKILKRVTESTDSPKIVREYTTKGDIKNSNCRMRRIVQKVLNESIMKYETNLIEEQNIYILPIFNELKLQTRKNIINGNKISATVTEYPFNKKKKKIPHFLKKVLGLELELIDDIPRIIGTYEQGKVKFSDDDKYLPYRFMLDENQKLLGYTKELIREKNLSKLDIIVKISDNVGKNTAGYFCADTNMIEYAKNCDKNFVDTATHEIEHALQYKLIGRLGKSKSEYERNSRKFYGPIRTMKERGEAFKYYVAAEEYPKLKENENPMDNIDYVNNYLEIKAREAAKRAVEEYKQQGKEINDQFFFGLG